MTSDQDVTLQHGIDNALEAMAGFRDAIVNWHIAYVREYNAGMRERLQADLPPAQFKELDAVSRRAEKGLEQYLAGKEDSTNSRQGTWYE